MDNKKPTDDKPAARSLKFTSVYSAPEPIEGEGECLGSVHSDQPGATLTSKHSKSTEGDE